MTVLYEGCGARYTITNTLNRHKKTCPDLARLRRLAFEEDERQRKRQRHNEEAEAGTSQQVSWSFAPFSSMC